MSTMSISAPAVPPIRSASTAASRIRLTTRGRRLLVALAALPLAVGIGFAALSGGTALASGETVATVDFDTVTVMPGDTLWAIAEAVAPTTDPRTVINEIQKLNSLGSGSLQVGQQLAIPAQYAD
jgi:LysM repeat protein